MSRYSSALALFWRRERRVVPGWGRQVYVLAATVRVWSRRCPLGRPCTTQGLNVTMCSSRSPGGHFLPAADSVRSCKTWMSALESRWFSPGEVR